MNKKTGQKKLARKLRQQRDKKVDRCKRRTLGNDARITTINAINLEPLTAEVGYHADYDKCFLCETEFEPGETETASVLYFGANYGMAYRGVFIVHRDHFHGEDASQLCPQAKGNMFALRTNIAKNFFPELFK